jgi:hypothetical protein
LLEFFQFYLLPFLNSSKLLDRFPRSTSPSIEPQALALSSFSTLLILIISLLKRANSSPNKMGSTGQIFEYSAPPQQVVFDGFLFDMDGTIIDSTAAVEKHWEAVGNEIGVSHEVILQTSHGRRSIDILKILCPEKATWECTSQSSPNLPAP